MLRLLNCLLNHKPFRNAVNSYRYLAEQYIQRETGMCSLTDLHEICSEVFRMLAVRWAAIRPERDRLQLCSLVCAAFMHAAAAASMGGGERRRQHYPLNTNACQRARRNVSTGHRVRHVGLRQERQ